MDVAADPVDHKMVPLVIGANKVMGALKHPVESGPRFTIGFGFTVIVKKAVSEQPAKSTVMIE
jgi:hypothetical protein